MSSYVLGLEEIDRSAVAQAGGKGAHLGELTRLEGVVVPAGFCVTASAYQRVVAHVPALDELLGRLTRLGPMDRDAAALLLSEVRKTVAEVDIPSDVEAAITSALARLGDRVATAVRSSATTEDSAMASSAGLHDTFLDVVGPDDVLLHVRRCWASLYTERAVAYRLQHHIDPREVQMAVVVQQMVFPAAAGVLFTADPVTGHRKVASIEAAFGRGESLVSGHVNPDSYKVRDDHVAARRMLDPQRAGRPALSEGQVVRLARLGRRIEAHFDRPQDIEWCLVDDAFHIVQTRPITTLSPVPETGEPGNHVFMSVGHSQMMTDALRPLGLSLWRLTTPRPMYVAGGRLFVEVSKELTSQTVRSGFLAMVKRSDPLTGGALQTLVDRDDFLPRMDAAPPRPRSAAVNTPAPIETDPAIVEGLIRDTRASIASLEVEIRTRSGAGLLDFILDDLGELRRLLRESHQAAMAGMEATWWLNEQLETWLGEKNAADALSRSAPGNVTAEMGLELLRLADLIRPHPEVVDAFERAEDRSFLDRLSELAGGAAVRDAFLAFLDEYGARCVGEIDITRPRWSEQPTALVRTLLNHVRNSETGLAERRVDRGRREAANKEAEVLDRLRALPDGEARARETQQMIERLRTFIGFREFPKFGMIRRYFVYKQALLEEAGRLVRVGTLRDPEDIYFLTFQELGAAAEGNDVHVGLADRRREEHAAHERLTPPRVMTSDGEIVSGTYAREGIPDGALVGLPVSSGVVEGRARIVLDLGEAVLEPGDILVTRFTDPSWTPVFVGIGGLVTEVGGQMTHGSVIAREYGLPAVVAVERATELIEDGQRIRVHGTAGFVERLPDGAEEPP